MKKEKFEKILIKVFNDISKKENGFFMKSPTPMNRIALPNGNFKIIYTQKALCDFMGIINGKFILVEAKEISGIRFDIRRLKEHQIKQLASIQKHKGHGLIFFYIKNETFIIIVSIDKYLVHINQTNKKSININTLNLMGTKLKINEIYQYLVQLII